MSTESTLPPVTILYGGFVGDQDEPVVVKYVNSGISSADAKAYAPGQMRPRAATQENGTFLKAVAIGAVISGFGSTILLISNPGTPEAAVVSFAMAIAGYVLAGVALIASLAMLLKGQRHLKASRAFQDSIMTIVRTKDKLVPLPSDGWNAHRPLVDRMIENLEDARGLLAANARDGHALAEGEQKLLAALHDLGVYAKANYEDRPEYEAARDSIRAFMDFVIEVTRQADLQTANSPR